MLLLGKECVKLFREDKDLAEIQQERKLHTCRLIISRPMPRLFLDK